MLQRLSVGLITVLALLTKTLHCGPPPQPTPNLKKWQYRLCGIFPAWEETVGILFPLVKHKQSVIYLHPELSCLDTWVPSTLAKTPWKPHVVLSSGHLNAGRQPG